MPSGYTFNYLILTYDYVKDKQVLIGDGVKLLWSGIVPHMDESMG